jgi:hypothetical protein
VSLNILLLNQNDVARLSKAFELRTQSDLSFSDFYLLDENKNFGCSANLPLQTGAALSVQILQFISSKVGSVSESLDLRITIGV